MLHEVTWSIRSELILRYVCNGARRHDPAHLSRDVPHLGPRSRLVLPTILEQVPRRIVKRVLAVLFALRLGAPSDINDDTARLPGKMEGTVTRNDLPGGR